MLTSRGNGNRAGHKLCRGQRYTQNPLLTLLPLRFKVCGVDFVFRCGFVTPAAVVRDLYQECQIVLRSLFAALQEWI